MKKNTKRKFEHHITVVLKMPDSQAEYDEAISNLHTFGDFHGAKIISLIDGDVMETRACIGKHECNHATMHGFRVKVVGSDADVLASAG